MLRRRRRRPADPRRLGGEGADRAEGDGDLGARGETVKDPEHILAPDAQGLVELAAGLQDVGDLAPGDARSRTFPR
jgi:hypothetical protein